MSTQSGKNKGSAGKGSGDSAAGGKPKKKTVAASAAKPGRDEATVEITSAEETKTDLPRIEPDDEKKPAEKDEKVADGAAEKKSWTEPAEPADSVSARRLEKDPADKPAAAPAPAPAGAPAPPPSGPGAGPTFAEPPPAASGQAAGGPAGFARAMLKNKGAKPSAGSGKTARKAQLQLARLEPWSVMKFSFVMSLVCFVVLLVAVIVLYTILSGLGVFSTISDTVNDLTRNPGETGGGLDAGSWFSFFRVFGYTVLVGALNVLLITALSTVGSVIYNLAADLVGGIEVTLKEAD